MQLSACKTFAPVASLNKPAPKVIANKPNVQKLFQKKTVSNGSKFNAMNIWQPEGNKMFETFSFLPPLNDDQIAKQVDYIVGNGWVPCLEFANPELAYIQDVYPVRFSGTSATYYDNRYWTMWKLPMFGCQDASQVLREVTEASKCFPRSYVRLLAFDSNRQVQVLSFLVHRPDGELNYTPVEKRSIPAS